MMKLFNNAGLVRQLLGYNYGVIGTRGIGLRTLATKERPPMNDYENKIYSMLDESFEPSNLLVQDISGGCGSMFAILVESEKFKGIPMIKQHRLVNSVLKDEISKWHGVQLRTRAEPTST